MTMVNLTCSTCETQYEKEAGGLRAYKMEDESYYWVDFRCCTEVCDNEYRTSRRFFGKNIEPLLWEAGIRVITVAEPRPDAIVDTIYIPLTELEIGHLAVPNDARELFRVE